MRGKDTEIIPRRRMFSGKKVKDFQYATTLRHKISSTDLINYRDLTISDNYSDGMGVPSTSFLTIR